MKFGQLKHQVNDLTTAEMKYIRKTAGYSHSDHKQNLIWMELDMQTILGYIQSCIKLNTTCAEHGK